MEIYPEHNWDVKRFYFSPMWRNKQTQLKRMNELAIEFGVKNLDDWYQLSRTQVVNKAPWIKKYYKSYYEALKALYPDHNWNALMFHPVPRAYWSNRDNQRRGLEIIGRELGVRHLDDWYKVSAEDVNARNLSLLKNYFKGSLIGALKELYPHHDWNPIKFSKLPQGFWSDSKTHQTYYTLFKQWKEQHNITQMRDWYELPPSHVKLFQRAAKGIHGGVTAMLSKWFPETNWISQLQSSIHELDLLGMIKSLAKDTNVYTHCKIGGYSVDIYVPEWKLALEYQGTQHYQPSYKSDLKSQRIRDGAKRQFFKHHDTSLVEINHNWNGSFSQLRATIRRHRPDLLENNLKIRNSEVRTSVNKDFEYS